MSAGFYVCNIRVSKRRARFRGYLLRMFLTKACVGYGSRTQPLCLRHCTPPEKIYDSRNEPPLHLLSKHLRKRHCKSMAGAEPCADPPCPRHSPEHPLVTQGTWTRWPPASLGVRVPTAMLPLDSRRKAVIPWAHFLRGAAYDATMSASSHWQRHYMKYPIHFL